MHAFPIRNDDDHARAITLIDRLWDAEPDTPEADLLEVMSQLVQDYEARERAAALPPPDPRKLIDYKREELGLSQRKLGELLGWKSSGRVSEVLNGKRQLTLDMVRDFERVLGIPPGLLLADRSPSADGDVWVRLPADLVSAAQNASFAGCEGLDAMVRDAVAAQLRMPGFTSAASASVQPTIRHGNAETGGPRLSLFVGKVAA